MAPDSDHRSENLTPTLNGGLRHLDLAINRIVCKVT